MFQSKMFQSNGNITVFGISQWKINKSNENIVDSGNLQLEMLKSNGNIAVFSISQFKINKSNKNITD